jgi:hypothetical protein
LTNVARLKSFLDKCDGLPGLAKAKRVLGKHAGHLTLSSYLIPDLYWPKLRLDVEYDSEAFHASSESLRRGAQRTLALRVMDVDVVSLTKEVVRDVDAFDSVARLLCKRLGRRPPNPTDKYCLRRLELRELVLGA